MEIREVIAEEWLARTLRTYPCQSSPFLTREKDPFRNPLGWTLQDALAVILDELLLAMDKSRIIPALESIIKIQAVQEIKAGQALGFIFQLKDILRRSCPGTNLEMVYARIDELALMAFDLFVECREKTYQARANEVKRRVYVLERVMNERERTPWKERVPADRGGGS